MTKAGHIIQIELKIGTIRILETEINLEMMEIEVNIMQKIEETLRTETGHMIEVEAGIDNR